MGLSFFVIAMRLEDEVKLYHSSDNFPCLSRLICFVRYFITVDAPEDSNGLYNADCKNSAFGPGATPLFVGLIAVEYTSSSVTSGVGMLRGKFMILVLSSALLGGCLAMRDSLIS